MKRYRFKKIDAFSTGLSTGNPAGCIYPEKEMTDSEMQQIARELQGFVSEIGVVLPGSGDADITLRYFSCEREVAFCGHATVAIMYDLIEQSESHRERDIIRIKTNEGVLSVINRFSREGTVYIHAPNPVFIDKSPEVSDIARALDIPVSDIDTSRPLGIVQVGQKALIVPLNSLSSCSRCSPDYKTLRDFVHSHSIDGIHIATQETCHPDHAYYVRVFAPALGYLEDPATGSANAAFGYYLVRAGLWDGNPMQLAQGPDAKTPNIVHISRASDGSMLFGGQAVVRIVGYYYTY